MFGPADCQDNQFDEYVTKLNLLRLVKCHLILQLFLLTTNTLGTPHELSLIAAAAYPHTSQSRFKSALSASLCSADYLEIVYAKDGFAHSWTIYLLLNKLLPSFHFVCIE
jgi:hypothetical protein